MKPEPGVLYFIDDVARFLKTSRRTVEKLRRHGACPIPELPSIDKRARWSGTDILKYLDGQMVAQPAVRRGWKRSA